MRNVIAAIILTALAAGGVAVATAPRPERIGYVNVNLAILESAQGKKLVADLRAYDEHGRKKIDADQAAAGKLADPGKFDGARRAHQEDVTRRDQQLVQALTAPIRQAAEHVAARRKLVAVDSLANSLYIQPGLDYTDDVLAAMDKPPAPAADDVAALKAENARLKAEAAKRKQGP